MPKFDEELDKFVTEIVLKYQERTGDKDPLLSERIRKAVEHESLAITNEKLLEIKLEDTIDFKGFKHTSKISIKGNDNEVPKFVALSGVYKSILLVFLALICLLLLTLIIDF